MSAPAAAPPAPNDESAERVVGPAVCLGCGCACDDIEVVVRGGRIVEARRACPLGVAWFGDGRVPARVRVRGADATLDEAAAAAAALLAGATRPLVVLAPDLSCEAQRAAVAIADVLHTALDTVTTSTAMASILAMQERGRAGATLGELRNRADVVLFWGADPAARYPRYRERYLPDAAGTHLAGGRGARTVIAVDVGAAAGPADADERHAVAPEDEVAVLTALRALAGGTPRAGERGTGPAWAAARALAPRLAAARYLAIVADAEPADGAARAESDRHPGRATALVALSQAMNGVTRCALSTLRGGGNRTGADAVLTAHTGYPAAVDFARGHPRYLPHEGAAARLARGEVDAALVFGDAARLPAALAAALAAVPCAAVGPRASEGPLTGAAVMIDTGVAGIHEGGTALRTDDVPLPLRPALSGPPTARAAAEAIAGHAARAAGAARRAREGAR